MAEFENIHSGKIFTHVLDLLTVAEADLKNKKPDLRLITGRLNDDLVYRSISAGEFACPVRHPPLAKKLQQVIGEIRNAIEGSKDKSLALTPFLQTIEKFLAEGGGSWSRTSAYFVVPVIDKSDEAGLTYLRCVPKPSVKNVARRRFNIEDLTQDARLIEYFDSLAVALMKKFYFVKDFPRDPYIGLADYSYRLHFDCQITEGKSGGAAAIAMFALTYLQNMLGTTYLNLVAPQVGTLLTGEIGSDGRVLPVDNLEKKVRCAVDEFGPELKVIVANSEPLPSHLESRIKKGNIFYVGTVEELLAAVLSTGRDSRGLDKARTAVFQSLPREQKDELILHLLPEVPPDIYEGGYRWVEPVSHAQGVYSITNAWNYCVDIAIATDPLILLREENLNFDRKLIQVILDGSASMDGYWEADPHTGISRIASALFYFAASFNPANEDLVVGVLGYPHFEPVNHGALSTDLQARLQQMRASFALRERGPFIRPARQQSHKQFFNRRKRVFILSESGELKIPDLNDFEDSRVESLQVLELDSSNGTSEKALFSDGGQVNQDLLNTFFQNQMATMPQVEMDIGNELPIEWEPADATVSREDDRYLIKWSNDEASRWSVRVRLASQYPHQVKVSGVLNRNGKPVNYSFAVFPTITSLPLWSFIQEGDLTEEETQKWRVICSADQPCPECSRTDVHALHRGRYTVSQTTMFPSLEKLTRGWLALREDSSHWHFFLTGLQLEGVNIALVVDRLQYSLAAGYLEPVPGAAGGGGLYRLETQSGVYYFCYLS